jgi:S-DNA-T family DNA segregation ATPase FtsK/SpoIIIE
MARRKSLLKLPFLKMKINKKTVFNIFGFMLIGLSVILGLSFLKSFSSSDNGKVLGLINDSLIENLGGLSIFVPVITLLISAHFFNTKKLKLVKPNITIGSIFIFFSLLGVFQSGSFGKIVFENLNLDFSLAGAILILGIVFIIGLVLFLDTSIDVFVIFVFNLVKGALMFIQNYLFRAASEKRSAKGDKKADDKKEFIQDKSAETKNVSQPALSNMSPTLSKPTPAGSKQFLIKPLSPSVKSTWVYPPLTLLADINQKEADRGDVNKNAHIIEKTLDSFGIRARVSEVNRGPSVTQYALEITTGTRLAKITALSNDLALALAASTGQVRIEAPIPGRSLVGIEIPNLKPEIVTLKELLSQSIFNNNNDPLLVPLGKDVSGQIQASTINKMPHVLIAGTTGAGKSILLNSWICTFLFRTKPDELRMILVDPKRVELTLYNGIPHLLTEVVVEPDKIISALQWTVKEMEQRYKDFALAKVRNIEGYNALEGVEKKPYILFVIDELADLMIFAPGEAEELITRIAQMARATGIHLLLATQRPSVDVITGLMKANIPTRVAFNVSSMIDSRVIIDMPGAEKLLGKGDMLFLPPDQAKPRRIQGPYITEKEVNQLVKFLKIQTPEVHYTEEITEQEVAISKGRGGTMVVNGTDKDQLFDKAVEIIMQHDKASASLLQRRLSIGYARAARLLDQLEAAGYVSPAEGSKPREVIKRMNTATVTPETEEIVQ